VCVFNILVQTSTSALGLTSLPFSGYRGSGGSFPGIKLLEREFDSSPPCSAKVKNEWSYTSVLPVRLHGVERDSFAFTIIF
jgi:hypothetical protein